MGTGRKVCNIILRAFELCCAVIVLGIVSYFISRIKSADNGYYNSKIIYTEALAAIATAASIVLMPPLMYTFWAFPFDLAMSVMWFTSFGLLANLTGRGTCSANWYYSYWGYYWGGWYRTYPTGWTANSSLYWSNGCSQWRTVLAFAFIGAMLWLCSFFLGIYAVADRREDEKAAVRAGDAEDERGLHANSHPETTQVGGTTMA